MGDIIKFEKSPKTALDLEIERLQNLFDRTHAQEIADAIELLEQNGYIITKKSQ